MSRSIQRRRFNSAQSRQEARRQAVRAAVGCAVESLEDRRLFSTLTVNTVADDNTADNVLSLHEAIELIEYNGDPGEALGRSLDGGESAQIDTSTEAFGTNDTILFDASIAGQTITLGSAVGITGTMTIDGGASGMTLSGGVSQATWRAFYINSNAGLTLNNLTITNFGQRAASGNSSPGAPGTGGAIYVDHSTLTLTNCTLSNNAVTGGLGDGAAGGMGLGGAISIEYGSVTITGSTLDHNSAAGNQEMNYNGPGGAAMGGAIYNMGGTLTVTDSTLSNNSATGGDAYDSGNGGDADGGAVYVDSAGTLTVTDSTLSNNSATGGEGNGGANGGNAGGGALYVDQTGTLTVTGAITLLSNTATGGDGASQGGNAAGGAIANHWGAFTLAITGGTVEQNAAVGGYSGPSDGWGQGGAIYSANGTASLTFTNSTLSNNSATADANGIGEGGALFVDSNTLTVTNSTLAGNSAVGGSGGQGGAIYVNFGDTTISFSTLSANTAAGGGRGLYVVSGNTLEIDNSILGQSDNTVTDLESSATTMTGSNNLIRNTAVINIGNLSNADPKLGPLQDNGGPTQTMLPATDSPAIDAADDTLGGAPSTDQRGFARPAGAYDVGALELSVATLTVSSTADTDTRDSDLTLREAIELANGTLTYGSLTAGEQAWAPLGDAYDTIVFDSSIAGGTITLGSQMNVSGTVTVDGGTTGMTLSGSNSRAFYVTSTGDLTLNHLAVTNFSNHGADGSFSPGGNGNGGAIYVDHGTLTITDSTLSNNSATGGYGSLSSGGNARGGAIYVDHGTLTITGSTLSNNSAAGGAGEVGGSALGGAVYGASSTLTITNTTLASNTAAGGIGSFVNGFGQGGAIYAADGETTLNFSTVSSNTAADGGRGLYVSSSGAAVVEIDNSILGQSDNSVSDVEFSGTVTASGSNNLIRNATVPGVTSLSSADPKLGPLQDNGGPTQTMRPAADSPAIDAADDTLGGAPSTDQRGLARPAGAYDIGAAEFTHVTLTVSTTAYNDTRDADLSLREAVDFATGVKSYASLTPDEQAWASGPLGDAYTIVFDSSIAGGTIALGSQQLVISATVTIDGGTSGMTLSGSGNVRAFYVSSTGDLTLNKLTITNFSDVGADGVFAPGGDGNGGAIYVDHGTLTITNSTLSNNSAVGGYGDYGNGGNARGGAIYVSHGTVTLTGSTFSDNSATGGYGHLTIGGAAQGGAIYVDQGTLTITDGTLSNNSAAGAAGDIDNGYGQGGAIYAADGDTTLSFSTVSSNTAADGGRGLYVASSGAAVVEIDNSILGQSDNSVSDVEFSGTVTAAGSNNLIRNATVPGVTSLSSADPKLGPLQDNGGPTQTMRPAPDSPALDAADDSGGAVTADQRGIARPAGAYDVGALELSVATLTVSDTQDTDSRDSSLTLREAFHLIDGTLTYGDLTPDEQAQISGNLGDIYTIQFDASLAGQTFFVATDDSNPVAAPPNFTPPVIGPTAFSVSKTVTITGLDDGSGNHIQIVRDSGVDDLRLFYVAQTGDLTLQNLFISGFVAQGADDGVAGEDAKGGAIYIKEGTVTLTDSELSDNSAVGGEGGMEGGNAYGGAIYNNAGTLTLTNTTLSNNTATGGEGDGDTGGTASGGALYTEGGILSLDQVTFNMNKADAGAGDSYGGQANGGALYSDGATVTGQTLSLFQNEAVSGDGINGQAGSASGGALYISGGTFTGELVGLGLNTARAGSSIMDEGNAYGGAIYVDQATVTLTTFVMMGNRAIGGESDLDDGGVALGGALMNYKGTVTLTDGALTTNTATGGDGIDDGSDALGGAIYAIGGSTSLTTVTVAQNSARAGAGQLDPGTGDAAIYVTGGDLSINFSTITDNDGDMVRGVLFVEQAGTHQVAINNSILGEADDTVTDLEIDGSPNLSGSNNLIRVTAVTGIGIVSSDDPRLAPLADYGGDFGGGIPTVALLPDSPALDAAGAAGGVTTDARGANRVYNGTADIGAFESQGYTLTVDPDSTPQSAVVGNLFGNLLTVTLTENGFDAPIPNATILFTANPSGSASATFLPSSTTDSSGQARVFVTANNQTGSYTVTASLGGPQDQTADFALTNATTPSITSANQATFTVGTAGTFTITTAGFPVASLTHGGALPLGITFTDNGDGTATLSGTPSAGGTFTLTLTAANGTTPDATQTLTLSVLASAVTGTAPTITSPDHLTLIAGQAGSFTVTTTGSPIATLHVTGTLPDGVTFVDNGDGTATFSGTAASTGAYALSVIADNGVGQPVTQTLTITVAGAHPVIVTSGNSRGSIQVNNPDGTNRFTITSPFQHSGAHLASADMNGDGVPDVIAAAGPGSRARVVVYDGLTGSRLNGFRAFAKTFTGGIFVATGDVDGDGTPDLITSQGAGGASRTRVFSGADGSVLTTFQLPGTSAVAGTSVASADLNGDGFDDVITASGTGDRYATVRVLDGRALSHNKVKYLTTLSPDLLGFNGGAFVTTGDVDGDGTPDLIVSQATGSNPAINVFNGKRIANSNLKAARITSFRTASTDGARVASYDVNADGLDDIIASVTVNGSAKVKFFNGSDGSLIDTLTSDNAGGVFVA